MFIMDGHGWFLDTFHSRSESAIGAKSFEWQSKRHDGQLNVLYCDLHVGQVTPQEIPTNLQQAILGLEIGQCATSIKKRRPGANCYSILSISIKPISSPPAPSRAM